MSSSEDPITRDDLKKLIHDEVAPVLAATRTHIDAPDSGPAQTAPKPVSAPERQTHAMRSWERSCPDCGSPNPEYTKPDVFCSDCGVPLGNVPAGFEIKEGESKDLPSIKPCWNCGSQDAKLGGEEEEEE